MSLPDIQLPDDLNYIGVFLSFACNLNCSYCINHPTQDGDRDALFGAKRREMTPEQWADGLNRLSIQGDDLPITLQGGEPTLYGAGKGLKKLLAGCDAKFDLLTNLALPTHKMAECIGDQTAQLTRNAPYPSVRVSFHRDEMNKAWGDGAEALVERCIALRDIGFVVSDNKAETDVGIYVVAHPENDDRDALREASKGKVYFEEKEFLGVHDGALYGTYKYPYSTNLLISGVSDEALSCECRTSELLIDPLGFVWRCHSFLYNTWTEANLLPLFETISGRGFRFSPEDCKALQYAPSGHILDPDFRIENLRTFQNCDRYGSCIGCDTKVKNNRFQSLYDDQMPHTSVDIRNINLPENLRASLPEEEFAALIRHGIVAANSNQEG